MKLEERFGTNAVLLGAGIVMAITLTGVILAIVAIRRRTLIA